MTVLRCCRWRFLVMFMFLLHIGMTADTVISPETIMGTLNQPACFTCTTPLLEVHWMMDGEAMRGNSNREDGTTVATICFNITKSTAVTCYGETTSPTGSRSETDTGHVILISEDPTVMFKTVVPTDSGSTSSPTVTAPSNHDTPHNTRTLATPTHPMGGTESGTVATPTSPSGGGCEAGCIADNGTVTLPTPPICEDGCVAGISIGTIVGLLPACLVVLAILYVCWKKPRLVTFCSKTTPKVGICKSNSRPPDGTPVESDRDADIPTPPTSPPVTETNSSRQLSVVMFPEPPRGVRVSEPVSAETETEEGTEFVNCNSRWRQPHSARRRSVDEIASITGVGDNENGISGSGVQCFASQFGSSDVNTTTYSTDMEYLEYRPLSTVITMESTAEETQGSQ